MQQFRPRCGASPALGCGVDVLDDVNAMVDRVSYAIELAETSLSSLRI
jgi:hypothetical protein